MDSISVFVLAFGGGCLTGVVLHLWLRHRRRRAADHAGDVRIA